MMGDVVQLEFRSSGREQAYTCGCGGQTFVLLADGQVVCVSCNSINTPLRVIDVREGR
jgi:hypothetical protein